MARVELFITVERTQIITEATPASVEALIPAVDASVFVNIRGGGPALVYADETGGATVSNPLNANASGQVNGWVDEGTYTLQVTGPGITTYSQPYEALRADAALALDGARIVVGSLTSAAYAPGSVDADALANQSVTLAELEPNILPIGTIIQWWRPSSGHALPTGWLPCDGSGVAVGQHDFTGGGSITLPDLRNRFVLGANAANADGAAATLADTAAAAPGIRGVGSSHSRDLWHGHTVNNHTHTVWNHAHTFPDHVHTTWIPDHYHGLTTYVDGAGGSIYTVITSAATGGASWYGNTTSGGSGINTTYGQGDFESGGSAPGTYGSLGATDMRPKYVGLLHLIKVKNS